MSRPTTASGPRLVLGTVILVAAVLVGLHTLSTLLLPGAWETNTVVLLAPTALLVAFLRQMLRSRILPTAAGFSFVLLGLAAAYGGETPGLSLPQPTAETLDRMRQVIESGIRSIADGRIPVEASAGIEMLVLAGVAIAYLLAELIALGYGCGGLAGIALISLWAPAIGFERDPGILLLLAGGTTYLLLLAVTRSRFHRGDRSATHEAPVAAAGAAVVTAVAIGLGMAASALPFSGAAHLPSGWGDQSLTSPLRLSSDLDMRADLASRSERPLLQYSGPADAIDVLRMHSMINFDGQEWEPNDAPENLRTANGVLWPEDTITLVDPVTVQIEVFDLDEDRLPVPTEPRSLAIDGPWLYSPDRDEVIASGTSTRNVTYTLMVSARDLTAELLRADTAGSPEDAQSYLAVPTTQHEADIRALAQQVAAGAATTYDQAVALQSFLRNTADFTYETTLAPPQSSDAVWDFLTERRGYCVQYATAMVVMARTLGIPSRLGVGFLPGVPDGPGQFVVSARQAHAWPELYFDDAGWVRFEPTPTRQAGPPPAYADPLISAPATPHTTPPSTGPQTVAPGTPQPHHDDPQDNLPIGQLTVTQTTAVATVAVVILGLVLGAVIVLRRRRVRVHIPQGSDEWWARLRERFAEHGVTWTDATTPRQAARLIHEHLPRTDEAGGAVVANAHDALDRLVTAVEADRYSPRPVSPSSDDLSAWVDAVEKPLIPTVTAGGTRT